MSKRVSIKLGVLTVFAVSLLVYAATPFTPREQPWGYVAPPAISSVYLESGAAVVYAPWFETGGFQGDLYAYSVAATGAVDFASPLWSAREEVDQQNWDTGRKIVTTSDGAGARFRWDSLNDSQQSAIGSSDVLNFVRGDRSKEDLNGGTLRNRLSALGTIIHSNPVYVGPPDGAYYNFDDYIAFATGSAASRSERVYVGANDGMLHAFDANTGEEMFGYIPSMVVPNLSELKEPVYSHQYYVDGPLTAIDAFDGSNWKTILVGGLGAGGKGYFAVDVTDPTNLSTSESNVAQKLLWEYHEGSPSGGSLLGYSYSRPSVVRLNSGGVANKDWAMIAGNGYMSASGGASLHIRDVFTGSSIKTMSVGTASVASPNGLSSPAVADLDGNGTADVVYAGDLDGNVWKFDISDTNSSNWSSTLFFEAEDPSGNPQPIVAAPELSYHDTLGLMVFVATGRLFTTQDTLSNQVQSVYGLRDQGSVLLNPSLIEQTLTPGTHADSPVVTATNLQITTEDGWRANLPQYQNVIQDIKLLDARVQFVAVNASADEGENWLYELDYSSGGSPGSTIMDVDNDLILSDADNIDANNNLDFTDPEDVVVGLFQQEGLASRPLFANKGESAAVAIINHLTAIKPDGEPPRVVPPGEYGLVGGHFDLDTSDETYDYDDGDTHNHDHEWDDKTGRSEVDFFTIVACDDPDDQSSCSSDPEHLEIPDSISSDQEFHLLVSNAELSTGAILRINGSDITATSYQAQVEAALAGSGSLTTYTRSGTTGTQLSSFSASFDQWAIIDGRIIPTSTGCVRGNEPGKYDEYRNGALTIQAVNASSFPSQVNDMTGPSGDPIRNGKGSGLVKHVAGGNSALLWEATVFWHWDGDCYGQDDWDTDYNDCFGNGNIANCSYVASASDDGDSKDKDKDKDKDDGDEPADSGSPPTVPTAMDPGSNISDTTQSSGNTGMDGRIRWREFVF